MKKMFENPEVELEKFQIEDVLTASTPTNGGLDIGDGKDEDIEEGV